MTIERGADWGHVGALPATGVVVHADVTLRHILEEARREHHEPPVVGLLGGDLCRTLGGTGDEARLRSDAARTFPIDIGVALIDGRVHLFVSHLVARRSWWRGRTIAVMNAQWCGAWDLGPRAHPNDGLLDITDGDLSLGDRWKARPRLRTGTHVPHPGLHQSRVAAATFDLEPALDVWLDGERLGRADHVAVRVEPDALTVVI